MQDIIFENHKMKKKIEKLETILDNVLERLEKLENKFWIFDDSETNS